MESGGEDSRCNFRGFSGARVFTLGCPPPRENICAVIRNIQLSLTVYEVIKYLFSLFIKILDIVMPD